jgi:hypothetical protein
VLTSEEVGLKINTVTALKVVFSNVKTSIETELVTTLRWLSYGNPLNHYSDFSSVDIWSQPTTVVEDISGCATAWSEKISPFTYAWDLLGGFYL